MKHIVLVIVLGLVYFGGNGWTWGVQKSINSKTEGQSNNQEQVKKKDPLAAETIDQLVEIIQKAVSENNSEKIEQIKKINTQFGQENLLEIIQKINNLVSISLKESESTESKKQNRIYSQILAEIYKNADNNNYLIDKVNFFYKSKKKDIGQYKEAIKLYNEGLQLKRDYKLYDAIDYFQNSKNIYSKIGFKEGEANCSMHIADIQRRFADNENALINFEVAEKIYREIQYDLGEANCIFMSSYIYINESKLDKAIEKLERSLFIYHKLKDLLGEANCLKSIGQIYFRLSNYDMALKKYEESQKLYKILNDRYSEVYCIFNIGKLYLAFSDYERARLKLEEGLTIAIETKNRSGEASCIQALGNVYEYYGENKVAYQQYEKSLLISKEINDPQGVESCLQNLAYLNVTLCEFDKAYQQYEESLQICRKINDRLGEANCLEGQGDIHRLLGKPKNAYQKIYESLVINKEIGNRLGEANCLVLLGDIHRNLLEPEKSLQKIEEALLIFRDIKNPLGEANCLQNIGELYKGLSLYQKALKYNKEGLDIFRKYNIKLGEAQCLTNIAETEELMFEYDKAINSFKEALNLFKKVNSRNGEGICLQSIAVLYRNNHDIINMKVYAKKSLQIAKETKSTLVEGFSYLLLGDEKRILYKLKEALHYYKMSLSLMEKIKYQDGVSWLYYSIADTYAVANNYVEAEKNYVNSINIIENAWNEIKNESFKTLYFSTSIPHYKSLINFYFKRRNGIKAFEYAERSKSRSFLYLLGNRPINNPSIGVPPDLVNEEQELRQNINSLTNRILDNEEKDPEKRTSSDKWNEELLQLKEKHNEILEKIKLSSPEYASMISVNPLSVEEIQILIREDKNSALIEYYTTPDNAFMWLLDGKQVRAIKINANEKEFGNLIREFNSMISNPNIGINTIAPRAQRLYNLLLKPVEIYLKGKSRIAIVPHGSLHYLPFEALMNRGKFLVEQNMKLFYLPSASVYKYCKEKNHFKKDKITAFVNPDGTLPGSEKEAKYLKQMFPDTTIVSGKEVSEAIVKNNSGTSDIIHFGCHGIFDSQHPMYSALKFNPDNDNDGRLEVSEVFQMQLKPACLVTLSACESNVGSVSPGDEIIGLTRAFIYAGTPSILASLWKVDDDSTGELMASFYRELKSSDKIDALHAARLEMINKIGKRHPFYWASFVLTGDPR